MSDATQSVEIERIFDAPIDLVWSMWAEAEHFASWYGPAGASIPTAEMDVTVGGRRRKDAFRRGSRLSRTITSSSCPASAT